MTPENKRAARRQRWKVGDRLSQLVALIALSHTPPTSSILAKALGVCKRSMERYARKDMDTSDPVVYFEYDDRGVKRWHTYQSLAPELDAFALIQLREGESLYSLMKQATPSQIDAMLQIIAPSTHSAIVEHCSMAVIFEAVGSAEKVYGMLDETLIASDLLGWWTDSLIKFWGAS